VLSFLGGFFCSFLKSKNLIDIFFNFEFTYRNPQYPTDVHHEYEDKYILSEVLATSTIATFLSSLEFLGLTGKNWEQVCASVWMCECVGGDKYILSKILAMRSHWKKLGASI
jgi:hypothetical protein